MLVDVHCHLDHSRYEKDLDEVVERAKKAGVKSIITSGVNPTTNRRVLALSKKYDIVNASLGLYPIDSIITKSCCNDTEEGVYRSIEPFNVDEELEFIKSQKKNILAIGEIGLDYAIVKDKQKEMKDVFQKALFIAEKIKKPVVIHTRKGESDCLDILETTNLKKVNLHCFGGKLKLVKRAVDLGYNFSIPSVITRLNHFKEVVKVVPIQQLLTETDGPYLAPEAGGRSEPRDVLKTIKIISELKQLEEEEELKKLIYINYQNIFIK